METDLGKNTNTIFEQYQLNGHKLCDNSHRFQSFITNVLEFECEKQMAPEFWGKHFQKRIQTLFLNRIGWMSIGHVIFCILRLHKQIFLDISCSQISSYDVRLTYGTANRRFEENKVHKFRKKTWFVDVLETREFVGRLFSNRQNHSLSIWMVWVCHGPPWVVGPQFGSWMELK